MDTGEDFSVYSTVVHHRNPKPRAASRRHKHTVAGLQFVHLVKATNRIQFPMVPRGVTPKARYRA